MVWTRGVTAKLYYKLRSQEGAYMVVTSEITVATALRSEQGLYGGHPATQRLSRSLSW